MSVKDLWDAILIKSALTTLNYACLGAVSYDKNVLFFFKIRRTHNFRMKACISMTNKGID